MDAVPPIAPAAAGRLAPGSRLRRHSPTQLTVDSSPAASATGCDALRTVFAAVAEPPRRRWRGGGQAAQFLLAPPPAPGVAALAASGSSQFDVPGWRWLQAQLADPMRRAGCDALWVVDLRQESHGLVGKTAVGWWRGHNEGNSGAAKKALQHDESGRLGAINEVAHGTKLPAFAVVHDGFKPVTLHAAAARAERELVTADGARSLRLPMTDDTAVPPAASVDALLQLARQRPAGAWVHFHCLHGHGRTTLYMIMWDIAHNAATTGLAAIVARQSGLPHAVDVAGRSRKTRHFLRALHTFCREAPDGLDFAAWQAARLRPGAALGRLCCGA